MSDPITTQTRELAPARSAWHVALVRPETMTLLLLIFGLVGASYLSPFFLDINYILRSFTLTAEMSIVALVLTMVIISGEIDLSPAATWHCPHVFLPGSKLRVSQFTWRW